MMTDSRESDHAYILRYIELHDPDNIPKALKLMEELVEESSGVYRQRLESDYAHSLYIVRMLLDLWIPLTDHEKDLMLTTAICHTLTENMAYIRDPYEKMKSCGIEAEACEILEMISGRFDLDEEGLRKYYKRIQQNPMALLIVLTDRGSILQTLHRLSSWQVRRNIFETRSYYFPMCIYAKEHYPELIPCVSILMEKMRCLVELAEIMLNRYEARETELVQDILALREENATIKGIIVKINSEQ